MDVLNQELRKVVDETIKDEKLATQQVRVCSFSGLPWRQVRFRQFKVRRNSKGILRSVALGSERMGLPVLIGRHNGRAYTL